MAPLGPSSHPLFVYLYGASHMGKGLVLDEIGANWHVIKEKKFKKIEKKIKEIERKSYKKDGEKISKYYYFILEFDFSMYWRSKSNSRL